MLRPRNRPSTPNKSLFESRQNLYQQGALPRKDLDQARVSLVRPKANTKSPSNIGMRCRPEARNRS